MIYLGDQPVGVAINGKTVSGTFTPATDEASIIVDIGISTSLVKAMVLESLISDYTGLTGVQLSIVTIVDPQYLLADYAQVHPYVSSGLAKNASGTLVSTLYTRSAYSVGPHYTYDTKWVFRPSANGIAIKSGITYRWTAYLK